MDGTVRLLLELIRMTLPERTEVRGEIECFERERTDRPVVELAILPHSSGVSFRTVARVLG